jgi:hypothetical protein
MHAELLRLAHGEYQGRGVLRVTVLLTDFLWGGWANI